MELDYFNYRAEIAEGWWDRQAFVRKWWRMNRYDRRWAPPHYRSLRRALVAPGNAYLNQRAARPFYLEALPRRRRSANKDSESLGLSGMTMEEAVAMTVLLVDRRPEAQVAYLSMFHCVNHTETMERLWAEALEQLWELGCRRLLGPTGLSPYLAHGLLENYFHVQPPLHTPYNPPYLPELMAGELEPVAHSALFHISIQDQSAAESPASELAELNPFAPSRLAADLLPLLVAANPLPDHLPPIDAVEAAFLIQWLQIWPLDGWLATVQGTPVGFILLQPDLAPATRLADGGRNWLWRPWLAWRSRRPTHAGRLLFGAVLPAWRERGIGRQLWRQALHAAYSWGWRRLSIGPLGNDTNGASFLTHHGAEARQKYVLYGNEL